MIRSKEQILNDSLKAQANEPQWDCTASRHEQLTIEVLIDIRDELTALTCILRNAEKIAYSAD
ncbi:unnamed protein product [marine sediment metagenome]|uniref:NTP pyrophosphohydrolase MazG putative catalytic core domain-containing protein n=1 Tax=marine sediment metagenome TaxID=412755 RepID=X1K8I6_9ZZZZ